MPNNFTANFSFCLKSIGIFIKIFFQNLEIHFFFRLNCFIFKILTAMLKRIWNRLFCSQKLNALCAVLLKSNFARASSYVLDNNLANYLEFLLYACPSSLSRMNTRLSFFGTSFTDHSCKHTCFLSGFKKYLNVFFLKKQG